MCRNTLNYACVHAHFIQISVCGFSFSRSNPKQCHCKSFSSLTVQYSIALSCKNKHILSLMRGCPVLWIPYTLWTKRVNRKEFPGKEGRICMSCLCVNWWSIFPVGCFSIVLLMPCIYSYFLLWEPEAHIRYEPPSPTFFHIFLILCYQNQNSEASRGDINSVLPKAPWNVDSALVYILFFSKIEKPLFVKHSAFSTFA